VNTPVPTPPAASTSAVEPPQTPPARVGNSACLWCGKGFTPRRDGGKPQVFCRPACRRALDAAGRRWVADAIAAGALTVDALRNAVVTTRALPPGATSPAPVPEVAEPAPPVSAERLEEAAELLDDLLLGLFDLPGDAWPDLAAALPDELYDRIDQYIERCLQES
jgi:hypothetical protein